MDFEFSPNNKIVRLCIQGMIQEDNGNSAEGSKLFQQAWNEATNDSEKLIAAYHVARLQDNILSKLDWYQTALELALKLNKPAVQSAHGVLYENIARCYEELNDHQNAKKYDALAKSIKDEPIDNGPFYHGTKADLKPGDFLKAGFHSNYQSGLVMNHIYFTALPHGAGLAAALAKGDGPDHIYIVEPTGRFENDPNVTNKKFPGNPTRSYRTQDPLKIIGELKDWGRQTSAEIQNWRDRLAKNEGEIIN